MRCFAHFPGLALVFSACSLLSGCMAAHSVVAPMLQAGFESLAEKIETPESMGVSTARYRGMDCAYLNEYAKSLAATKEQGLSGKITGWNVDAINQVRAEQGCDKPGQARSALASQVPIYGFCWYSDIDSRRHFVSTIFRYADWYADRGEREQQQFRVLLKSSYGQEAATALCQGEDSRPKAEAARQKTLSMYRFANVRNINVSWTPTKPRAVASGANPSVVASVESRPSSTLVSSPVQGAFRVKVDAVTPAFAQSLGLASPGGALVIDTEKGSTAEKAGLRPLDIITEVEGQRVQTPADLQAIVGRMRPGYKAAVRVWRQKAMRDMAVEVAAPAR